jgi:8-oxo-dGTP pyrophosphatase MutT (NUDIX family)
VILLRRGGKHEDRALEVLLVRRSTEARFMPGVWVFPGGAVTDDDRRTGEIGEQAGGGLDRDERAHRACAIRELEEEAGIKVPTEELRPWSRWITPEPVPIRFDTRFYVALAPPHSPPRPDGSETIDAAWVEPPKVLERHRAGEVELVFPTIKHLESLTSYPNGEAVMAAVEGLPEPVLPKLVGEGDERRVVLPGDPGYES